MKIGDSTRPTRDVPPTTRGGRPHLAARACAAGVSLACAAGVSGVLAAGCMNNGDNRAIPPVVVAIAESTPAVYDVGETKIYQVTREVRLPMRRPTDEESKALGKQAPYPRAPFLNAGDVRMEVRFTLSNLDDKERTVELLVDPWNEFARYRPGVVESAESVTPNFSGIDRYFVLPPKGRVEGTLTADDMREMSVDLATAMAILENPPAADGAGPAAGALINRAMNQQNRSSAFDPLVSPYVPRVIAGLTGFDLGLRAGAQMNVALEVFVDVTDVNGDRMAPTVDPPATFGPPGRVVEPPPPPVMK